MIEGRESICQDERNRDQQEDVGDYYKDDPGTGIVGHMCAS